MGRPAKGGPALRERLAEAGVEPLDNDGADPNYRAIVSMLQLAGRAAAHISDRAAWEWIELAGNGVEGPALRAGQDAFAKPRHFRALAEQVFGRGDLPSFVGIAPGPDGRALLADPLRGLPVDPRLVPDDAKVFVDWGRGIEAVSNAGDQPWSAVLSQVGLDRDTWRQIEDEAFVRAFPQANPHMKAAPALAETLREFAAWLQQGAEQGRPPLKSICLSASTEAGRAGLDPHMAEYCEAMKTRWGRVPKIKRALTAAATGQAIDPARRLKSGDLAPQDAAIIDRSLRTAALSPASARFYARVLGALALWLRGPSGDGRPKLPELVAHLVETDGPAIENEHVIAFRDHHDPHAALGKPVGATVDAATGWKSRQAARRRPGGPNRR